MKPKNTICLWFDKDAHEAARFYAATFPDSQVTAVHEAPSDYPGGKEGDVLTVEFTVLGIPCLGLNGGPEFRHSDTNAAVFMNDRVRQMLAGASVDARGPVMSHKSTEPTCDSSGRTVVVVEQTA